jgi:RNA exonuclease 4
MNTPPPAPQSSMAIPPPAAAANPDPDPDRNPKRKRKSKPKPASPAVLNPNWAQLQAKLPHRPAATHLGKRKDRTDPSPWPEPEKPSLDTEAAPGEAEVKLEPTSDDTR